MKKLIFLPLMLMVAFSSCEDDKDCSTPEEIALGIGFKHDDGTEEQDIVPRSLKFYALAKSDTTLYENSNAGNIHVPLDPKNEKTLFFITPNDSLPGGDTLNVRYKVDLSFISPGCGFTHYFDLDTVFSTHHYIDSTVVTAPKVNSADEIHIEIFY